MKKIIFWTLIIVTICLFSNLFTANGIKDTLNNIQTGVFMGFSVAIGNMLSKQHIEKPYKKLIHKLKDKKKN